MDLWNLDPSNGFFNGIIMVCKYFEPSVMCVEIIARQYARKQVLLPRIPLLSAKNEGYPFYFKHAQLSIQLNFAMTINNFICQSVFTLTCLLIWSIICYIIMRNFNIKNKNSYQRRYSYRCYYK